MAHLSSSLSSMTAGRDSLIMAEVGRTHQGIWRHYSPHAVTHCGCQMDLDLVHADPETSEMPRLNTVSSAAMCPSPRPLLATLLILPLGPGNKDAAGRPLTVLPPPLPNHPLQQQPSPPVQLLHRSHLPRAKCWQPVVASIIWP